ncbi:isopeptide-forming domain-containing fimbrial protein [Bifidobacterium callitrichidarum]|uniref:Uncharacterized protein n=1 Tax=Bifidobacterium callitrichidarum TaxID=2052941 RepID=A0A2U2NC26_9BIFI|nr:isopeptide-forming domain-containing fimbrial protein [Bifidobacterium callitrichidarum]PWG66706.1 hypothetical protein DF196_02035 [Bifidobacterium callitrichidarum]
MPMIDKRIAKRVLAGLTAAASLAAGGVIAGTAMAADTAIAPDKAKDGTIKLLATNDKAFDGKTATLQAIPLATYDGGTTNGTNLTGISVTTNADYKDAITAALGDAGVKITYADNPVYDVMQITGDTADTIPSYSSALRKFATSLNTQKAIKDATGTPGTVNATNKKEFDFTGLTPGYYLIRDTTPKGHTGAIPMIVGTTLGGQSFAGSELGTVVYKSIDDDNTGKTEKPDPTNPDKGGNITPPAKDFENSDTAHKVGDYLKYTVTQKVPNTTGYPGYRLNLRDTLGASLDYVNDATHATTITVNGKALDASLYKFTQSDTSTTSKDGRVLTWEFGAADTYTPEGGTAMDVRNILKDDATKAIFTPGATITVTYYGQINEQVTVKDGLKNIIATDYSNNPNAWGDQLGTIEGGKDGDKDNPSEAHVGEVTLTAVDKDKNPLTSDASFQIFQGADKTPQKFVKVDDQHYTLSKDGTGTDTIVVPAGKNVTINGIAGNYHVSQVAPFPTGFSASLGADFYFNATATQNADKTWTKNSTLVNDTTNKNGLAYQNGPTGIGIMQVKNLSQLPATGSTMQVILGAMAAIVAAGVAVSAVKAKQSQRI